MLPLNTDYAPMEAQLVDVVPEDGGWQYEPKWDGFRCLVFRNGDDIQMRSKSGQPLHRYFPEIVEAVRNLKPQQFVIDGELVVKLGEHFSFDDLLQRIHPVASRIKMLSTERPATLILFDILVDAKGRSLVDEPLENRREALEEFARKYLKNSDSIVLSPATTNYKQAERWWNMVGKGLDGLVAKRLGMPYQSGTRKGMLKVKKMRTADCVVGGFRYAEKAPVVGSLLLGLYDDQGLLNHVGFTSSFKADQRKEILRKIEPLISGEGFTGNKPGGPSRWSTTRSGEWQPLKPKLVVEVQYDHFTDRFRHGTKFLRWRPDKDPHQCTYDQLQKPSKGTAHLLHRAS
jgi:ATP-dependent DNA ligase